MDDSALKWPDKTYVEATFRLEQPTRKKQRRALALKWLSENEHSHYRYIVAKCKSGSLVYVSRPTRLNKGFDFSIHIKDWTSPYRQGKRKSTRPRHSDVVEDLRRKRRENPKSFKKLAAAVYDVYRCAEPSETFCEGIPQFRHGLKVDVLLHVLKWMFIEQDLTYWNGRGRRKLWEDELEELFE
jgi:hypothetical protein